MCAMNAKRAKPAKKATARKPKPLLTQQQWVVLTHLVRGLGDGEIATAMGLKLVTIKHHMRAGRDRLNARNRVDFAVKAIQRRLVELPPLDSDKKRR